MAVRKLFATIEEYEQRFGEGSSYGYTGTKLSKRVADGN